MFLASEINSASANGTGILLSGDTAELLLHLIEPLQVGYGAVVSFLFETFDRPNFVSVTQLLIPNLLLDPFLPGCYPLGS